MKLIYVLLTIVLFSLTSYAQKTSADEYIKDMLSRNIGEQQQIFFQRYAFSYLQIKEEHTDAKGSRTLQVVKSEIKDTIKPFFNTITVNAETLSGPIADLKNKSKVYYFSANSVDKPDEKIVEGELRYNVTHLPYISYSEIYSNVTSVTDDSGKQLLLNGKGTAFSYSSFTTEEKFFDAQFKYENAVASEKLTVSGTVTIKVPTKFLITSFTPAEVGKSKEFQQYTFTLDECASGKVVLSSSGYKVKSRIDIYALGAGNVRYWRDGKRGSGGTIYTDEFVYDLINSHTTLMSKDSLNALYFNKYINYLQQGSVKLKTVYADYYKGNIEKVCIVTPIEYYTTTETFSITTE